MENTKGETPLITAVKKDNEEVCKVLLNSGADPYKKTAKVFHYNLSSILTISQIY